MKISAAEFKAKCLKIMDQVNSFHNEVIITKHGKPIAKLVPYNRKPARTLFGYLKNSITIRHDITKPIDEKWDVE
jgi:prevent-host-death family protein